MDKGKSHTLKFLSTLWVAQEILKLLPSNPPWKQPSDRSHLQDLKWNDEMALEIETRENSFLILRYTRLILTHSSGLKREQPTQRTLPTIIFRGRRETKISKKPPQKDSTSLAQPLSQFVRKVFRLSSSMNVRSGGPKKYR